MDSNLYEKIEETLKQWRYNLDYVEKAYDELARLNVNVVKKEEDIKMHEQQRDEAEKELNTLYLPGVTSDEDVEKVTQLIDKYTHDIQLSDIVVNE